jgi:D-cysteine desulfhydrase
LGQHPARTGTAIARAQETSSRFHLFERFPKLDAIPRASLCTLPSPVQLIDSAGDDIWIKRDDLNAPVCGGNKVRALELLLGGLHAGDTVVTVGGAGSTHVLATAVHAARLGVGTMAMRWKHDMNPIAVEVSDRVDSMILNPGVRRNAVLALASARYRASRGGFRYIPVGGSTPLGILGHVNAALELAEQIRAGEIPLPGRIVVPVGTGGTAAGLLLGFAIARLGIEIMGARVGPRIFANRRKVLALSGRASDFLAAKSDERLPSVDASRLVIAHHVYGGAYGRALPRASAAANILHDATGMRLDDTYSAKAWAAALEERHSARGPLLFWLTFDASCLTR